METSGVPLLLLGVLAAVRAAPELKCPAKFLSSHQPEGSSCCSGCRPGFFLKEECSKTSKSVCIPCPYGSYSTQWNNLFTCLRCDECGYEGMQYKRNCTRRSNAQCECSKGYICEDSDCRSCITKGGAVTSNPCSSGTFSDTGAEPCRPWTNCTSLGYVEISPGSQMRDTICDYSTKVTPTQRDVLTCQVPPVFLKTQTPGNLHMLEIQATHTKNAGERSRPGSIYRKRNSRRFGPRPFVRTNCKKR
ncbi:tumor necrosis factor receptor superfamily member 5-like isoform X2 [Mobula birostris]|uniref:tumor necrosis factor receptor superfamily member 5-like isoform X2 n=1 Tax=Mobula birostris TaxID=1983395 RepID=UPI003B2847A3